MVNTLLLVEDNVDDEALSVRAIKRSGVTCTITIARDGIEAVHSLLISGATLPDLVVLDFHLPGFNGLEVLRQIRADPRTRRMPVVMLSAMANGADMDACREAGANSCVQKPNDPHEYTTVVAQLIRYWFEVDSSPAF